MKYKIDLHVHSKNSGDNNADPEESIERAIEQGLDGIAFTEHYSFGSIGAGGTFEGKVRRGDHDLPGRGVLRR